MIRGIALSGLLLTLAGEARADGYPPCTKKPTPADLEGAKSLHNAAKQYLARGVFEKAVETWLEAYAFDCTKPEVFINIGTAFEGQGNAEKALEAYRTYVERKGAGADAATVAKVQHLEPIVAEKRRAEAAEAARKASEAAASSMTDKAAPSQDVSGSPGPWPWVVVGVGGALGVTGAALLGVGTGKVSDAEDQCPGRNCAAQAGSRPEEELRAIQSDGNLGIQYQRLGAAILAVGAATIGGGVAWYLLADPAEPTASTVGRWRLTPTVAPGNYGLAAHVAF